MKEKSALADPLDTAKNWGMWYGWQAGSLLFALFWDTVQPSDLDELGPLSWTVCLALTAFVLLVLPWLSSMLVHKFVIDHQQVDLIAFRIMSGQFDFDSLRKLGWRALRLEGELPSSRASLTKRLSEVSCNLEFLAPGRRKKLALYAMLASNAVLTAAFCISLFWAETYSGEDLPGALTGIDYLGIVLTIFFVMWGMHCLVYSTTRKSELRLIFHAALLKSIGHGLAGSLKLEEQRQQLIDATERPAALNCLRPPYRASFRKGFALLFTPVFLFTVLIAYVSFLNWFHERP